MKNKENLVMLPQRVAGYYPIGKTGEGYHCYSQTKTSLQRQRNQASPRRVTGRDETEKNPVKAKRFVLMKLNTAGSHSSGTVPDNEMFPKGRRKVVYVSARSKVRGMSHDNLRDTDTPYSRVNSKRLWKFHVTVLRWSIVEYCTPHMTLNLS